MFPLILTVLIREYNNKGEHAKVSGYRDFRVVGRRVYTKP